MQVKEITVFTEGNSSNANVWSNIPYFITTTLEAKGYLVHRVDVEGNRLVRNFYDKFLCRILRKTFMKKTSFSYNRTSLYAKEVNRIMRRTVALYPNSCCYLSTSFSFAPSLYTQKPTVLFCDWTYDYYFQYFLKRKPDFLETPEIARQDNVIEQASYVFVLFPDITAYMRKRYHNKNIFYCGNVINAEPFSRELSSLSKRQSNANILFIGLEKYKKGVDSLIQAIISLHTSIPNISLDIIGMEETDFEKLPPYVHCHGYLNKNILSQKELYNSLLNQALVYVNTTPVWAGFSSALEALYHYVPIITTMYPSFVETFGSNISFGYYCEHNDPALIAAYITTLLSLPLSEYTDMCEQAHAAVTDFTWDNYVNKMLEQINFI